jgi:transketolase
MNNSQENYIESIAKKLRRRALKMALDSKNYGSHLGGGLSTIELFATLYCSVLNISAKDPTNVNRDRLIISKGHCVLAYYSVLNEFGFLTDQELEMFEVNGCPLHGHATRDIAKGIEFSGGSLGLGLAFSIGIALSGKSKGLKYNTYVILGDGECNEGSIWESLMSAAHFELDKLTVIVDNNRLQYDGPNEKIMNLGNLRAKFESFGFHTQEVDGHNIEQLLGALSFKSNKKPKAIIANTIKGKGVSFMENNKDWHHSKLTQEQYDIAISEQ